MRSRILLSLLFALSVVVASGCASTSNADAEDAEAQRSTSESSEPAYLDSEPETKESDKNKSEQDGMTIEKMSDILEEFDDQMKRKGSVWQLEIEGVDVIVVADSKANRMRIVAPIAEVSKLDPQQLHIMLEANFHTALDARYATSQGVVYAAFLHPLENLDGEVLRSAVRQVVSLVQTFGDTYSSGELVFPG